jgi:hypothetical protein
MSLHLEFEPHSWYKGFAIKRQDLIAGPEDNQSYWYGVTPNGMTGFLVEFEAMTLRELKQQITEYNARESKRIKDIYARLPR